MTFGRSERELTAKQAAGTWQYDSVNLVHQCVMLVKPDFERLPKKEAARRWFELFTVLRNKTKGHGAIHLQTTSDLCVPLQQSIELLVTNLSLLQRPWVYLHRNLSGRYRVIGLNENDSAFSSLKTSEGSNVTYQDGVYVYFDKPRRVELMFTGPDAKDFMFPNGHFSDKRFETISYITGENGFQDSIPYLYPTSRPPRSETEGLGLLTVQGKSFANLPPPLKGYVPRPALEDELCQILRDDRHPVITLVGRGGIGKTWLTINVLNRVAQEGPFEAIVWLSARDIDLLSEGPKLVTPKVLTPEDVADEYVRLLDPGAAISGSFSSKAYLEEQIGQPGLTTLLVMDNFETLRTPTEVYIWLNSYVRLPNKVLITTRIRDFKGDYPIEVRGMTKEESDELIRATAMRLRIEGILTDDYREKLYSESGGHPYVMKVLLGKVAKTGRLEKPARIVASRDDILNALFERTYADLTPGAKRVFLTLCGWRTAVAKLAIEATIMRSSDERLEVDTAVEELERSSFIELLTSEQDEELFLSVPLVAASFGKRKITTSPMKSAIEADLELLRSFGPAQQSDIARGVPPQIERLFSHIAKRTATDDGLLDEQLPMLEFIARRYPPAWLQIARLYEESEGEGGIEIAKEHVRRYIEASDGRDLDGANAWHELARLCSQTGDYVGEVNALVELCQLPEVEFFQIANAVNRTNHLFKERHDAVDSEEKQIVSRRLAEVMEARIHEADADDCAGLAWLYLRLKDTRKATEIVERGLSIEPQNYHCLNVKRRLQQGA